MSRTSSPYSLTDAVSELTANTAATNTDTLNQSLDTLATTLDQVAPQLGRHSTVCRDCRDHSTIATRVWPSC